MRRVVDPNRAKRGWAKRYRDSRDTDRDTYIVIEKEATTMLATLRSATNLMRNENKLKSNFRITSSLAFQCKFKRQQQRGRQPDEERGHQIGERYCPQNAVNGLPNIRIGLA